MENGLREKAMALLIDDHTPGAKKDWLAECQLIGIERTLNRILPMLEAIQVEIESSDSQNGRDMLQSALDRFWATEKESS